MKKKNVAKLVHKLYTGRDSKLAKKVIRGLVGKDNIAKSFYPNRPSFNYSGNYTYVLADMIQGESHNIY